MAKTPKFERMAEVDGYTPVRVMLFSFLYALVFGACSVFPWMTLKDLMPDVALAMGMPNARATGAIYISSILVFGIVAFSLFCILWHKLEKNFSHKRSFIITLKWCIIAILLGLLALVAYSWLESMKAVA
ncbi:MAG: hypothetical protein IKO07_08405 [Clostridia bacterium]|nr:hypothetical protein [Clostridia bacterium]